MTAIVTGKRDDQYLVDFGDGTGSIYDPDGDIHVPAERRGYVGRSGRALHGYAVPACIRTARLAAGCVSAAP